MKHRYALWWVKRDFRLYDNQVLSLAVSQTDTVIPLYVLSHSLQMVRIGGGVHMQAVFDGVFSLRRNLRHHDHELFIRTGEVTSVFSELHSSIPFTAIYAYEETGLQHTYARDREVAKWCRNRSISFIELPTNGVIRGLQDRDIWQSQFQTFIQKPLAPIPKQQLQKSKKISLRAGRTPSLRAYVSKRNCNLLSVTERAAHEALLDFLHTRSYAYSGGISSMNRAPRACSRLSIHLAWGTLSLATVFQSTQTRIDQLRVSTDPTSRQWVRSLQKFQSRLFWHAHFVQNKYGTVSS